MSDTELTPLQEAERTALTHPLQALPVVNGLREYRAAVAHFLTRYGSLYFENRYMVIDELLLEVERIENMQTFADED